MSLETRYMLQHILFFKDQRRNPILNMTFLKFISKSKINVFLKFLKKDKNTGLCNVLLYTPYFKD